MAVLCFCGGFPLNKAVARTHPSVLWSVGPVDWATRRGVRSGGGHLFPRRGKSGGGGERGLRSMGPSGAGQCLTMGRGGPESYWRPSHPFYGTYCCPDEHFRILVRDGEKELWGREASKQAKKFSLWTGTWRGKLRVTLLGREWLQTTGSDYNGEETNIQ